MMASGRKRVKDLHLPLLTVSQVFLNPLARRCDNRTVTWEKRRQVGQLEKAAQGGEIVDQATLWRRDDDRSNPHDTVTGDETPRAFLMQAEVTARMARCPKSTQSPLQTGTLFTQKNEFAILDVSIDRHLSTNRLGRQPMRGDGKSIATDKVFNTADMVRMEMSDDDLPQSLSCSYESV